MSKNNYIYGRHPVLELLRQQPGVVQRVYVSAAGQRTKNGDLMDLAERHQIQIVQLSKTAMDDLVMVEHHQGIAAAVKPFAYWELDDLLEHARKESDAPILVALDQVQDPNNLGAILRSVHAMGGLGVIIPKDRACEVTPAVVKASAGAALQVPVTRVTNLRRALLATQSAGFWVIGAAPDAKQTVNEVDLVQPICLVAGAEGKGMRPLVAESCDLTTRIPMPGGFESLNVSVSVGILLYEAQSQRLQAQKNADTQS